MSYCNKCGKKLKDNSNFCNSCGTKIKNNPIAKQKTNKHAQNKSSNTSIFLIIVSIYLVLNFVALQELEFDTSIDSLVNTLINTKANAGLSSANIQTTIRLKNPTIIPVFLTAFSYDVSYGIKPVIEGKTSFIFIMPYSSSVINADAKVSYINVASTILGNVVDLINGNQKTYSTNLYAELGPIKIPVR